ncbi:peptidylprolyl isomerase [Parasalinivibrio latis]|uniref:peptidylprolyl isomerase n=1 Tax=Parasalinivibrio latis TaxID=2952610 RepID=UPI0030E5882C
MRHIKTMGLLVAASLSFAIALPAAATDVLVTTNLGSFTIKLDEQKAPVSSANFLKYVKDGSYKGTIFHRVIPGFMAQGGGFTENFDRLPTYAPIKNESNNGLQNVKASVAMARTQDPDSATRQFYINYNDNHFLDGKPAKAGYAVFGHVIKGFSVVEKMAAIPTKSDRMRRMADIPTKPIVIEKMEVVK